MADQDWLPETDMFDDGIYPFSGGFRICCPEVAQIFETIRSFFRTPEEGFFLISDASAQADE